MSEQTTEPVIEPKGDETTQAPPDGAQNTETQTPAPIPYERFKEVIEAKNAAENRISELEKTMAKFAKEKEQAETDKLKEQEQYKELAETWERKHGEIAPQFEQLQAQNLQLLEVLEGFAAKQVELVPEVFRPVVEAMPVLERLTWLTDNADQLTKEKGKAIPKTPQGVGSANQISDEERRKRARRTF